MNVYQKINFCRVCKNTNLVDILDLGEQALTGCFPKNTDEEVPSGPLSLVKCHSDTGNCCNLVQLKHSYHLDILYNENYGYRSSLNSSMITHLHEIVDKILEKISIVAGDTVIDVGSNDGTTLNYFNKNLNLIGIDPTADKFKEFYQKNVNIISSFFSFKTLKKHYPSGIKAKLITSFSMFYDLENPVAFAKDIYDTLDDNGIWAFENSYLPLMLEKNSFDTICHEHLEYYSFSSIKWILDKIGMKVIDIEFNDTNGGSILVLAAKKTSNYKEATTTLNSILKDENNLGINTLQPYLNFEKRVELCKAEVLSFLMNSREEGKTVIGLGASTKGNVLLQYCNIDKTLISCIAEVNKDKYGCFTPGSKIPIVSENQILESKQFDFLFVLPWHFKDSFLCNDRLIKHKNKLIFPLPNVHTIMKSLR